MPNTEHQILTVLPAEDATGTELSATIFVALELSLTRWVVAASAPGKKASQHSVSACNGPALLTLLDYLCVRAEHRLGKAVRIETIEEAGRDGFWVHRLLEAHGARRHVVDPSSIAVNRRSRRAKTDRIDAEAMLRTLMAWSRGERQVCAMVRLPSRDPGRFNPWMLASVPASILNQKSPQDGTLNQSASDNQALGAVCIHFNQIMAQAR